ncbi:MAG: hypothetical protein R2778_06875 [Saprospiraceae bacterium]
MGNDAPVDVLFFCPTTYTGTKRYENQWNADVKDSRTSTKKRMEAPSRFRLPYSMELVEFMPRVTDGSPKRILQQEKNLHPIKLHLALAYTDIEAALVLSNIGIRASHS